MVSELLAKSIVKKQIVAITGLMMVGFILAHLAGNLLIFLGPKVFNGYAAQLASVPEILWVMRIGLIAAFILHVYFTILLWLENRAARPERYAVAATDASTFAGRTMIYTGALVFFYLWLHLANFTFGDREGPSAVISGQNYGLYGIVWNTFSRVPYVFIYVVAMTCIGFHLSHGIQSMCQTVGFFHDRYTPAIRKISIVLGAIVAVGFSLIPLYVLIRHFTAGPVV